MKRQNPTRLTLLLAVVAIMACGAAGCATVPVKAWQRERLVDPIVAFRTEKSTSGLRCNFPAITMWHICAR